MASECISIQIKVLKHRLEVYCHGIQWWPKLLEHYYFNQLKSGFKSVISVFCCSASVGNISLHFQTLILPLIVIIQWDFCLHKKSVLHTEIWSDHHQSVWNDMKKQNKLRPTQYRRTVSQDASETSCKAPETLCSSAPRTKAALNAEDAHTKCWFS